MKYAVMMWVILGITACSNDDENCPCDSVTLEGRIYYIDGCKTSQLMDGWEEYTTPKQLTAFEQEYPCSR